jgi:hypothetical protein
MQFDKKTIEEKDNNFRLLRELNIGDILFIYLITFGYQIQ